jgi:hypothetical protein
VSVRSWVGSVEAEIPFILATKPSAIHSEGAPIDDGTNGLEVDQNVLWNDRANNFLLNGGDHSETHNNIQNNLIPDVGITSPGYGEDYLFIHLADITNRSTTRAVDSLVPLSVDTNLFVTQTYPHFALSNGYSTAPGAFEMNAWVRLCGKLIRCTGDSCKGGLVKPSLAFQPGSVRVKAKARWQSFSIA